MVKTKCKHKKMVKLEPQDMCRKNHCHEAWLIPACTCPDGKDFIGGVVVLRLIPPSPVSLQASLCSGGEGCRLSENCRRGSGRAQC